MSASRRKLSEAVVTTGIPQLGKDGAEKFIDELVRVRAEVAAVRRFGSAALDLAWVAAGRFDGFWERGLSLWDIAAGFVLMQEAGGMVIGLDKKDATQGLLRRGQHQPCAEDRRAGRRQAQEAGRVIRNCGRPGGYPSKGQKARTSIRPVRATGWRACDLDSFLDRVAFEDVEAEDDFLALGERAIRDHLAAAADAHGSWPRWRRAQALAHDALAAAVDCRRPRPRFHRGPRALHRARGRCRPTS